MTSSGAGHPSSPGLLSAVLGGRQGARPSACGLGASLARPETRRRLQSPAAAVGRALREPWGRFTSSGLLGVYWQLSVGA